MRKCILNRGVLSVGIVLICLACVPSAAMRPAGDATWPLSELKNATYAGFSVSREPVTLVGGRWEGRPYVQGGSARPSVDFVDDLFRVGKLGHQAAEAAVVFLAESAGGSGTFLYLAVVESKQGRLVNTATAPVGDRVQIRDLRLDGDTIVVNVLQAGAQDAACCPGELANRRWQWAGNRLMESTAPEQVTRFSLDVLAGTTWKLRAWAFNEPAAVEPTITLTYADGRFAGSAGCNRYFASVEDGCSPGEITVGPSGSTRMICPEATMTVEQRFLNQLQGVKKVTFLAGRLALSYESGGNWGSMCFERMSQTP